MRLHLFPLVVLLVAGGLGSCQQAHDDFIAGNGTAAATASSSEASLREDSTTTEATAADSAVMMVGGAQADATSITDADFLIKAGNADVMEIEAAQLAQSKSADPMVKEVAQMLLKDHTKANEELKQLADKRGVRLPSTSMEGAKQTIDKLKVAKGKDFDKLYLDEIYTAHQKKITLFDAHAKTGQDAEVRAFVDRMLPVLREHGSMIEKQLKML